MTTLEDLRAVLAEREQFAPDVAGFVVPVPHSSHRRRTLAAVAAVAACLALVVGVVAIAGRGSTPAAGTTVARWAFSVDDVPGYTFTRTTYSADMQAATIRGPHGERGLIEVHLRGVVESAIGGQRTTINGRRAILERGFHSDHQPMVILEVRPGAWAEVGGTFAFDKTTERYDNDRAFAIERQIALAVRMRPSDVVTMPLAIDTTGLRLEDLGSGEDRGYCLEYSVHPNGLVEMCRFARRPSSDAVRALKVSTTPHDKRENHVLLRDLPDGSVLVLIAEARTNISRADLRRLLDTADGTPVLSDRSTWLAVTIPG